MSGVIKMNIFDDRIKIEGARRLCIEKIDFWRINCFFFIEFAFRKKEFLETAIGLHLLLIIYINSIFLFVLIDKIKHNSHFNNLSSKL